MILNTTHFNKEHKQLLIDVVGKTFTFLEALKMKGIGSKRMIINDVSPNLKSYMNTVSDVNYVNIELRKSGILLFINKGLQNFTWAIPYYQLVMYKTNGASIHAQGKFVQFKNSITFKENKAFFEKMLDEKIKYDEQYNFHTI
ncbi:hypothetical protein [uncultured Algibacter sp.]|uniref:hypothetical protein n=1 Tax=uncultured Algibacter sp. TaxID=298659 RepID=UPI0030EDB3A8|tara:strand:- start:5562 stop:5990 length:429 start_codon:yes stop_codon:yes gene_type:complete